MSTFFATLRPLILAKLLTVSQLKTAFDTHTEKTTGYPYATVEPSVNSNEMYTNSDNLREYSFDIIVWHEMKVGGRKVAVDNLSVAIDAIIDAFDSDTTLRVSGGVHYIKPISTQWGDTVAEAGPLKFVRLTVACGVEVLV